jgi:hypothetical protein
MSNILVRFRENKKVDSDHEVIGKALEGEHEGKVAFLSGQVQEHHKYADQEVLCEVVKVHERSIVVVPVSSRNTNSSGYDVSNLFKD